MDDEVARDHGVPGWKQRLMPHGHLRTDPEECCNEFLSLKDRNQKQQPLGQRLMSLER
jgi:hypothetical protein